MWRALRPIKAPRADGVPDRGALAQQVGQVHQPFAPGGHGGLLRPGEGRGRGGGGRPEPANQLRLVPASTPPKGSGSPVRWMVCSRRGSRFSAPGKSRLPAVPSISAAWSFPATPVVRQEQAKSPPPQTTGTPSGARSPAQPGGRPARRSPGRDGRGEDLQRQAHFGADGGIPTAGVRVEARRAQPGLRGVDHRLPGELEMTKLEAWRIFQVRANSCGSSWRNHSHFTPPK